MSPLPAGADKYRKDAVVRNSPGMDMIERANALVSVFDVLEEYFSIYHPRDGGSYKGYCFGPETELLTSEGPEAFGLGERFVETWDGSRWVKAHVRCYGHQAVQRVVLRPMHRARGGKWVASRTSIRQSLRVTPDHRWLTQRGEVTDLRLGDVLPAWIPPEELSAEGVVSGFVYGDGEERNRAQGGSTLYYAPLHGEKDARLRYWLEQLPSLPLHSRLAESDRAVWFAGWTEKPGLPGVPVARIRSRLRLKELPSSPLPGFLRGWCLADAWEAPNGVLKLFAQESDSTWLRRYAASQGFALVGMTGRSGATNYGSRRPSAEYSLVQSERAWRVEILEPAGACEVWCAETDSGWLTLAGGLASGNCPFGFEHPDGGVDKGWRTYPATNSSYCFVEHGGLPPVRLLAIHEDVRPMEAARRLLDRNGLLKPRGYKARMNDLILSAELAEDDVGDVAVLVEALNTGLRVLPAWQSRQFDTDVIDALEVELEKLEVLLDTTTRKSGPVRDWYKSAKDRLTTVIQGVPLEHER